MCRKYGILKCSSDPKSEKTVITSRKLRVHGLNLLVKVSSSQVFHSTGLCNLYDRILNTCSLWLKID